MVLFIYLADTESIAEHLVETFFNWNAKQKNQAKGQAQV